MKYALINANLLDGTKNMKLQPDMTVLIDDGRITDVGSGLKTEGYKVIDLQGKYLLPGLINLHAHLPGSGFPSKKQKNNKPLVNFVKSNKLGFMIGEKLTSSYAKTQLLSGVTTVRAVGGIGIVDASVRDKIDKGKLVGSRLVVCNEAVTVAGGHMEGVVAYGAADEQDMVRHIRAQVDAGADWVKLMITGGVLDCKKKGEPGEMKMTPEQVKVCCDEAHALGKKVCAHVESPEGVKVAVECGVDSIEHGAFIDMEAIEKLKKHDGVVVATLSPALPILYFDCGFADRELVTANAETLFKGMIQCDKACLDNGIRLGLGTDAGCPYTTHYDTWRELEYFHQYLDITREEALYHGTLGNAEILGLESETGSIEKGKSADFIVTEKNPLDNFDALRKLDMVSLRGKIIENPAPKKCAEAEEKLDEFYYNQMEKDSKSW